MCVSSWGSMGFGGLKFRVLGSDLTSGGVKNNRSDCKELGQGSGFRVLYCLIDGCFQGGVYICAVGPADNCEHGRGGR